METESYRTLSTQTCKSIREDIRKVSQDILQRSSNTDLNCCSTVCLTSWVSVALQPRIISEVQIRAGERLFMLAEQLFELQLRVSVHVLRHLQCFQCLDLVIVLPCGCTFTFRSWRCFCGCGAGDRRDWECHWLHASFCFSSP